jgi:ATP-dependent Clp protease protease subunit
MSVSAPYYGDSAVMRTPPPDLPSLLLKERIVYLGLPLFSDDDAKRQMGIDVTELIIAQLLYLEFDNPEKPIFFYINSTGTSWYSGDAVGFETEAFAIADTIRYVKPPVHTICIGQAMGTAAMILSAGTKGQRAALPQALQRSGAPSRSSPIRTWRSSTSSTTRSSASAEITDLTEGRWSRPRNVGPKSRDRARRQT